MSLYRKYRPKDFPSLIGQEHIKTTLLNAIKAGNIAHAYLFTGPRGTGKTTTARLLAKAINAEIMTEDGRFDGSEIAEEIDNGRLIDVIEIDAASNRGIDEIRDLREKINYAPTRAKNKVYIIDEVHMLTKEAFNALLKTLEEPPSFVYFILATTEINKVPETIISRCQRFDFRRITELVLIDHLRQVALTEDIAAEEEALRLIAKHARGGARDALTLLEQIATEKRLDTERVKNVLGISNFSACDELLTMLEKGQIAEAMTKLDQIFQAGVDLVQFNKDLLDYLRQKLLETVRSGDHGQARRYIDLLGFFQEAYEKQKFSYIPELPLEVAIAKAGLGYTGNGHSQPAAERPAAATTRPAQQPAQSTVQAAQMDTLPASQQGEQDDGSKKKSETTEITGQLNLEKLLAQWNGILNRIQNPLAKRCLMSGKPVEFCEPNLTLAFSNNFNKDKLFVPELLSVVELAIFEQCGQHIKLQGKIDPGLVIIPQRDHEREHAGIAGGGVSQRAAGEQNAHAPAGQAAPVKKSENMLESAMNVFGTAA
jgi:DNA polymerase-3 subunit gamma/tau